MANWRRGFFRLWVLLTILWAIVVVVFAYSTVANPYISETLFTFGKDDQLEIVPLYGETYTKMLADERSGYYTRVGFKNEAPRLIYMAPNALQVTILGKKFEALVSNERLNNPDHEGLVVALMDFITKNELDLAPPVTIEEVRSAIPEKLDLQYETPEVRDQVLAFAIANQTALAEEARRGAIVSTFSALIFPPLVLLVLGAAVGWVLTGFHRKRPTPP